MDVTSHNGGRPLLGINIDQIEMLRQVGYSWKKVADVVVYVVHHFGGGCGNIF